MRFWLPLGTVGGAVFGALGGRRSTGAVLAMALLFVAEPAAWWLAGLRSSAYFAAPAVWVAELSLGVLMSVGIGISRVRSVRSLPARET
jgi:hypothetical protein